MRSRWSGIVTLVGVGAWLVVALAGWWSNAPLGHDEAQYAISTRESIAGGELRWFYLSSGMHAIARPGIWLGGSELALRFMPLLLGVGFVLAAWSVARRCVSPLSAGIALLVLAGTRGVARYSSDLLSDLPSAAAMLAALAVILDEVDRETGPRWRIVIAAPLLASAIYVRYGSVVPVAVIVVATLAVGARVVVRRPWPVIATAGLFIALLVPHFVQATALTGSPLGILLASSSVPQERYFAEGLVSYLTHQPFKLYGLLAPIAMLAGVVSVRRHDRRRLLAWIVAVASLVALGIVTHAQSRYVLLSIAILVALGVEQIRDWLAMLPAQIGRAAGVVLLGATVIVWLLMVRSQYRAPDVRRVGARGTLTAAAVIRRDAGGAPCMVLGYHYTQLEWYSGCRAPLVMSEGEARGALARGERVYLVRDYLPSWASAPQPELSGRTWPLFMLAGELEVARLLPP